MKFCKTHPDREAVKPYRMCAECLSETKKRLQKKYSACLKETWMEVNLENLLSDAQKMTIGQLASRYRIYKSTVKKYLSKNNITPKNPFTCGRIPKNDIPDVKCTGFVPDMRLACGNIYPKHDTHFCECFDNPKEENSCPICGQANSKGFVCPKCRKEFPVKK